MIGKEFSWGFFIKTVIKKCIVDIFYKSSEYGGAAKITILLKYLKKVNAVRKRS